VRGRRREQTEAESEGAREEANKRVKETRRQREAFDWFFLWTPATAAAAAAAARIRDER